MSAANPEDYTLKREEVAYTAYLERMVLLMSKRIIWTLKEERFDHLRWISTFRKLYKNLHVRDKTREVGTRFSETTKELAELLGITPRDNWVADSTSRISSITRRILSNPDESKQPKPQLQQPPQNSEADKEKSSNPTSSNKNPLNERRSSSTKPPANYDAKIKSALDKIVDSKVSVSNMRSNHNKDPSFFNIFNPGQFSNIQEESHQAENTGRDYGYIPPHLSRPRPKKKYGNIIIRKRCQTPQMYYNGSFDNDAEVMGSELDLDNPRQNTLQSPSFRLLGRHRFDSVDRNKSPTRLDTTSDLNLTTVSNFRSQIQTPSTNERPRSTLKDRFSNNRTPAPLKAFTGTFYEHQKGLGSGTRKTSLENENSRSVNDVNEQPKKKSNLTSVNTSPPKNFATAQPNQTLEPKKIVFACSNGRKKALS